MDSLDRTILGALAENARTPYAQIAKQLGVATATVHQRMKRLRESGVVRGFRLELDWAAVGLPVAAVISIRSTSEKSLYDIADDLRSLPYVASCVAVTGEFDLFATVRAHSSDHLGEVVDQIRRLAKGSTRTVVVLKTYFLGVTPPLGGDPDAG
ncbi:MAG TPA: Lrp/AsnC family transcriptional regulator [Acidimicrobiia bacterium]|jgi:DNA-binding Lrp family transcriptional regulator|nr:Lrp/AsnC family transcriptional regulator [Acidimicrobiia bacterium]